MPPVAANRFIGKPMPLDTKGKVALFYFWAHWCSDCKRQKPALIELHERYAERGLAIIGPTHLFGYAEAGRFVSPAEEIEYVEGPWQKQFPLPEWMPKPLSQENWGNFGVSTTPTLVLVDRQGIVQLYHPGAMTLEELEAAVKPLL
jgi:thiol-disulfide isomerase/thioredoxin